jgi:ABC-type enterochelin transport system substrate-binding protein
MRHAIAALAACLALSLPAYGQDLSFGPGDSVQSLLSSQRGKTVTVRTSGGQELTGKVRDANQRMVVLTGLSGREFFDAAIPLEKIEAVLIRTK